MNAFFNSNQQVKDETMMEAAGRSLSNAAAATRQGSQDASEYAKDKIGAAADGVKKAVGIEPEPEVN